MRLKSLQTRVSLTIMPQWLLRKVTRTRSIQFTCIRIHIWSTSCGVTIRPKPKSRDCDGLMMAQTLSSNSLSFTKESGFTPAIDIREVDEVTKNRFYAGEKPSTYVVTGSVLRIKVQPQNHRRGQAGKVVSNKNTSKFRSARTNQLVIQLGFLV